MRGATIARGHRRSVKALFQSTRPMRGATGKDNIEINRVTISIHAPHAGRD